MRCGLMCLLACALVFFAGCGGDGGGSGGDLGGNILAGAATDIELVTNGGDSTLMHVRTSGGGRMSVFGCRDTSTGVATHIQVVEVYETSGTRRYVLDATGLPLQMIDEDGNTIEFEWLSTSRAVLQAVFSSDNGNVQVNTVIDFFATVIGGQQPALQAKAGGVARPRGPVEKLSQPFTQQELWAPLQKTTIDEGSVFVTLMQCGAVATSPEQVSVRATTRGGTPLGRYPALANESAPGVYIANLPVRGAPILTLEEVCGTIPTVIARPGANIDRLNENGSPFEDSICVPVEQAIELLEISEEEKIEVSGLCSELTLSYQRAARLLTAVTELDLCVDPTVATVDTTYPEGDIRLQPFLERLEGGFITTDHLPPYPELTLTLPDEVEITSFRLTPSQPADGESYVGTATISCIPAGSQVSIGVVGSDGFRLNEVWEVPIDLPTGVYSLLVPGGAQGVVDVMTVRVRMPDGTTIERQASLVFGPINLALSN